MTLRFLMCLTSILVLGNALALTEEQRAEGRALLASYTAEEDSAKRLDLLRELLELDSAIGDVMWKRVSVEWKTAWSEYQKQFAAASQALRKAKNSAGSRRRAKQLVKQIRALSGRGQPTKESIRTRGDPALKELRRLNRVDFEEVMKSSFGLSDLRGKIHQLAEEYNMCIDELGLIDETTFDVKQTIEGFERASAAEALPSGNELRRVNRQNAKHVGEVPAEALEGIRDLNELRSLLGLRILLVDPKLCLACAGHSKDMETYGFFAHQSPVSGKETMKKRAAKAGTTASSENIAAGRRTPQSANEGWWRSPAHHVIMLDPANKRVGLGHHGVFWTQMFGR
ncbi:MAG: hypothetical protein GWQ05_11875 [Verrucomicrobiaceae bacterium]|nr:hypothetical protein [Verrucomicrobiaceae bacterium]